MINVMLGDNWVSDKLNRKSEADFLTNYLVNKYELCKKNNYSENFVLNVNADWGFGKTYFLKNWADHLSTNNHPVVYFDAWENDFSSEPLPALISIINEQLDLYFKSNIDDDLIKNLTVKRKNWYEKGKKIIIPYAPILLNFFAKKTLGFTVEQLRDMVENQNENNNNASGERESLSDENEVISSLITKVSQDALARHSSTKIAIQEFKEKLKELTGYISEVKSINSPVFIFIDELDRCRPTYSIELLENIKHLFGVKGIYFVIATASTQLCESIKKVYGYNFDSQNYLKRFFDQIYTLQKPTRDRYSEYLFNFFRLDERSNLFSPLEEDFYKNKNRNCELFYLLNEAFETSLRDMYQYCMAIDCISISNKDESIHIGLLTILLIFRDKYINEYILFSRKHRKTFSYVENLELQDILIKTFEIKDTFTSSSKSLDIKNFIMIYIYCAFMPLDEVRKKLRDDTQTTSLELNILNSIFTKQKIPLCSYICLIEQVGKIS